MDNVKFRAWVKADNEMTNWYDGFFSDMSSVTGYSSSFPDLDEVVLMQFTGLLDINGIEIYEGDIVYFQTFDSVDVVIFEPPCFKTGNHSLQEYECKVIGNIHETPELLQRVAK